MVKMSEFQRKMYNMFMENLQLDAESCIGGTNPLKAFAVACKVSIFLRTNVCGVDTGYVGHLEVFQFTLIIFVN